MTCVVAILTAYLSIVAASRRANPALPVIVCGSRGFLAPVSDRGRAHDEWALAKARTRSPKRDRIARSYVRSRGAQLYFRASVL